MPELNTDESTHRHFVPPGTKPEATYMFMTKDMLPLPNIVVSVVGSNVQDEVQNEVQAWMKEVLKALVKVSDNKDFKGPADVWILKDGRWDNVGLCLGKALQDKELPRDFSVIGIAPRSLVQNRQQRINSEGHSPVLQPQPHCLDNNCKALLLVEDGTETEFQINLEEYISYKNLSGSNECIEVLSILISGEATMLERVDWSLMKHIPWLVLEGSGPAANLISDMIKHPESKDRSSQLSHMVHMHFPDGNNKETLVEMLGSIYSNKGLITVCNAKESTLKDVIRMAMPKGYLPFLFQRKLVEKAEKEIFNKNINWTTKDLENFMTDALVQNQPQFVALYLKKGFNINQYMTYERLERLYQSIQDNLLAILLQKKRKNCKFKPVNNDIEMGQSSSQTPEAVSLLLGGILKGVCDPSFALQMFGQSTSKAKADHKSVQHQCRDMQHNNIWASLFIWAVLQRREEMFYFFLKQAEEPLLCALGGCKILRELSKKTNKSDVKRNLTEQSRKLEQWAYDLFSAFQQTSEKDGQCTYSYTILIRESPIWGGATCLQMAKAAEARLFMSHDGVQALLSKVWWGDMEDSTRLWKLILSFFIPPLIYTDFISFCSFYANCEDLPTSDPPDGEGACTTSSTEASSCLKKSSCTDCCCATPFVVRRLMQFWSAPSTTFLFNVVMYLFFLGLFAYVLLVDFKPPPPDGPSIPEIVLYFWVFTLFCEEMRQAFPLKHTFWSARNYFKDWWNIWDLFAILLCAVGFCCRMFPMTHDTGRVTLAIDYMVFTLRVIHIFSGSRQLGPKIIMVRKMFKDLFFFLLFLAVWLIAYGVANHVLLFPYDSRPFRIMQQVLYRPYMVLFGEIPSYDLEGNMMECTNNITLIEAGTMEACLSTYAHWLVVPLMLLFLLVINILLVNLLIAMFSDTFSKVHEESDMHWKFQSYSLVEEYNSRPYLAPPFIILSHINIIIKRIKHSSCCTTCEHSASREWNPNCTIEETASKRTLRLSKMLNNEGSATQHDLTGVHKFLPLKYKQMEDKELMDSIWKLISDHHSRSD